jgi:hypothetical protein
MRKRMSRRRGINHQDFRLGRGCLSNCRMRERHGRQDQQEQVTVAPDHELLLISGFEVQKR